VGDGRGFLRDLVVVDEHLDGPFRLRIKEFDGSGSWTGWIIGIRIVFGLCVGICVIVRFRRLHGRRT